MGDQAGDILLSFMLREEDLKKCDKVMKSLEKLVIVRHIVICEWAKCNWHMQKRKWACRWLHCLHILVSWALWSETELWQSGTSDGLKNYRRMNDGFTTTVMQNVCVKKWQWDLHGSDIVPQLDSVHTRRQSKMFPQMWTTEYPNIV